MPRALPLLTLLAALVALLAPGAAVARAAGAAEPGEVVVKRAGQPERVLRGVDDVAETVRDLRRSGAVEYAARNVRARAAGPATYVPDDTYRGRSWAAYQWHLLAVNAPLAWGQAIAAGAPGGRGVTIAVLDTGVAYANRGPYRRSPDLAARTFVRGWDFVDRDPYPNDANGHGTHVASTIAQRTGNARGLAGLAYGVRIMPLRVLDAHGDGNAAEIAAAVRHAVRRRVDVINLSLEFGVGVRAREIPGLLGALAAARRAGILVVGAAGNDDDDADDEGEHAMAFPSRSRHVLAVGATTERGCLSRFSNFGPGLELVAPGGGRDAQRTAGEPGCDPAAPAGRPILQLSFAREGQPRGFGLPTDYEGTSMAVPQVSATAALVIATRVLGARPSPARLRAHLAATARDLGPAGPDSRYGAGLVDAAAATAVTSSG